MFKSGKRNKENNTDIIEDSSQAGYKLSNSLEANVNIFKNIFMSDDTIVFRHFSNQKNSNIKCCLIFIDGMIDREVINENIIEPITKNSMLVSGNNTIDALQYQIIPSNSINKTRDIDLLIENIINGDTILFIEGSKEALIISTKGWQSRAIEEPETEKILRGPREGFTESIMVNLTLIRRKIKSEDLKFKFRVLGKRTNTKVCICYIDGIANKKILNELNNRLDKYDLDSLLDANYIQECIKDSPLSPFKTLGSTERPDIVAAKLLEGRIAIVIDGTPVAITVPHLFLEYFQSNDDYYINFYFSSIGRLLRIIGYIITISVPAIYLSLITFHQEMIPTQLLLSISAARQGVPFPTIVELLVLLLVFEILREAGTRMPTYIGQALSIVGALVLGQAAVEAKFVSSPIVIVVALSGITGLIIQKLTGAIIIIRLALLLLSSLIGLYGYTFGIAALLIHLFSLRSFGMPYMSEIASFKSQEIKDTAIRAPWWYMKYRPKFIASNNLVRKGHGNKRL